MSKINAVVVTISDTRISNDDLSGDKLAELLMSIGATIVERLIVTDELTHIRETLFLLAERDDVDLMVTTGGTGFSPRDNTPEATRAVIEREAPGMAEAMRFGGKHPMSMLSRAVCGIRGKTLIVNLPGSPRGVEECFEVIRSVLPHAIELIRGNQPH
jgi:molybdopterin adenylyltransferase